MTTPISFAGYIIDDRGIVAAMKYIDDFLNQITMYRLVLYFLLILICVATVFGTLGILPYSPLNIVGSTLFLVAFGWITNFVFSQIWHIAPNFESVYISALILALIISPAKSFHDLIFLFWAAVLTMASKFIVTLKHKHIFNPVAIALVIITWSIGQSPTWWIGTLPMLPLVSVGGYLIIRKVQRGTLVISFLLSSFITILFFSLLKGTSFISILGRTVVDSPLIFFASIMLTEPFTTPPGKLRQGIYGTIVGLLFAPQIHLGHFYTTPELALVMGNVFSFFASPTDKLLLKLKEKIQLAPDIYDFIFARPKKFIFTPGQYMEWTLDQFWPDSRGNRRYITLASSPTEEDLHIGIKFHSDSSSFKRQLLTLTPDQPVMAAQLSGEFTLPSDKQVKCVLIAGGIGITPYRSMIKYMLDTKEKRELILIYCTKTELELVYRDIFDVAHKELGLKTIYSVGRIDGKTIAEVVPNFKDWRYYLSGPRSMIVGFEDMLKSMGINRSHIKIDFFPGFA